MSKNFELMQQAGRRVDAEAIPAQKASPSFHIPNGNGHSNGNRFNVNESAQQEILKLVQRAFLIQGGESPRTVLFAGIDPGNGCSRTCARAAKTLAANVSGKVCIVDANLHSPSLPDFFGMTNHHGLTDSLLQDGPITNFTKKAGAENLWLLSCGSRAADSTNLLNSRRLKTRLAEIQAEFDYVLIDAPPLNQYADAVAIGRMVDGVVLILEAESTRKESAIKVAETLRASGVQVLGAVLNKREYPIPESLYHKL